jgi:hypothetical protein
MRSIAVRQPGHVSNKTFAWFSVAICVALLGAVVAVIIVRTRQQNRALDAPIARASQDERALRMGWTQLGESAAANPPAETQAEVAPNQSLPPSVISSAPMLMSTSAASGVTDTNVAPSATAVTSAAPNVAPPTAIVPGGVTVAIASAQPAATPAATPSNRRAAPAAAPADEPCGNATCTGGQVCCNASCGTCVAPGQKCSQFVCGMNVSLNSVPCGPNTCNTGEVCCNASCGTCTKPGETCDTSTCDNAIQYPTSESCGMTTCNVGTVCCNPSCGICAAPGEPCSQTAC